MEELIRLVSERSGISPDEARSAVETLLERLRAQQAGAGSQQERTTPGEEDTRGVDLSGLLGGLVGGGGQGADLAGLLGGLMGGGGSPQAAGAQGLDLAGLLGSLLGGSGSEQTAGGLGGLLSGLLGSGGEQTAPQGSGLSGLGELLGGLLGAGAEAEQPAATPSAQGEDLGSVLGGLLGGREAAETPPPSPAGQSSDLGSVLGSLLGSGGVQAQRAAPAGEKAPGTVPEEKPCPLRAAKKPARPKAVQLRRERPMPPRRERDSPDY